MQDDPLRAQKISAAVASVKALDLTDDDLQIVAEKILVLASRPWRLSRVEIEQKLAATDNVELAATQLGCSRRTLQNHMRALGMPTRKPGPKRQVEQPLVIRHTPPKPRTY